MLQRLHHVPLALPGGPRAASGRRRCGRSRPPRIIRCSALLLTARIFARTFVGRPLVRIPLLELAEQARATRAGRASRTVEAGSRCCMHVLPGPVGESEDLRDAVPGLQGRGDPRPSHFSTSGSRAKEERRTTAFGGGGSSRRIAAVLQDPRQVLEVGMGTIAVVQMAARSAGVDQSDRSAHRRDHLVAASGILGGPGLGVFRSAGFDGMRWSSRDGGPSLYGQAPAASPFSRISARTRSSRRAAARSRGRRGSAGSGRSRSRCRRPIRSKASDRRPDSRGVLALPGRRSGRIRRARPALLADEPEPVNQKSRARHVVSASSAASRSPVGLEEVGEDEVGVRRMSGSRGDVGSGGSRSPPVPDHMAGRELPLREAGEERLRGVAGTAQLRQPVSSWRNRLIERSPSRWGMWSRTRLIDRRVQMHVQPGSRGTIGGRTASARPPGSRRCTPRIAGR